MSRRTDEEAEYRRWKRRFAFSLDQQTSRDLAVRVLGMQRELARLERELALLRKAGSGALHDQHAQRLGFADALEALTELGRAQAAGRTPHGSNASTLSHPTPRPLTILPAETDPEENGSAAGEPPSGEAA